MRLPSEESFGCSNPIGNSALEVPISLSLLTLVGTTARKSFAEGWEVGEPKSHPRVADGTDISVEAMIVAGACRAQGNTLPRLCVYSLLYRCQEDGCRPPVVWMRKYRCREVDWLTGVISAESVGI